MHWIIWFSMNIFIIQKNYFFSLCDCFYILHLSPGQHTMWWFFIKIPLSQRMGFISNLLTFGLAIITNMLPRFLPPIFRINSIWIWKIKYPINIKPAIYFTEIFASLEFGLIDWVNRLIAIFYLGFRGEIVIMISTNYHTALIAIWQIFYQFLMFSNLFQKNS